ncbi:MAG: conserved phage C-terminal domain-containing protein, partial [Anaeroglobus sp.]
VEESKVKEKKIYSPSLPSVAEDIVSHLNSVTGSSYRSTTSKTRKLIAARLAEGFTADDFKTVITKKAEEWTGTDMAQYLRPETLFGTKFEGYLNQPEVRNSKRSNLSRAEQERREGINAVNRLMAEYEEEARGQNE